MADGGAFIDDGEGHEWADALRMPPWIEDRDGHCFYNLSFLSPDARFERLSDAGEGGHHARPADIACPFHGEPIATTDKDNPHAR